MTRYFVTKKVPMNPIYDSEREVFYVDVGNMRPEDVLSYIQKVREEYERAKAKKCPEQ